MRVFLYISYDGSKFQGFQKQPNKNSVMDRIIFALKELGITSKPIGSGRTDSGVHALNQVVHIDLPTFWEDLEKFKNTLNRLLYPSVYVRKTIPVSESLHARFDAKKRLYRYICYEGEYAPFLGEFALLRQRLDVSLLNQTLSLFQGKHDFGYFKKTGSPTKDDIRTLYKADAYRYKKFTVLRFLGDGFLRSQVRMMAGAAFAVQEGTLTLDELKAQIDKKIRIFTKAAPSTGLYLSRIYYDF
ncbi:MAG: tRNA pseudouridine(38-40) synthase TruA [Campylobacteraceae bacterium]|jgi:tRNA pseudouridine38-40 synthase|nr:tRNA pseudouridine(38-40) synthase TruA [Campylobacteraceae bacterium]